MTIQNLPGYIPPGGYSGTTSTGKLVDRDISGYNLTGSGSVNQTGPVPGAPGGDPTYGAVMRSIARMMPIISGEMLEVVLLAITTKMKDMEEASQKDKIKVDQEAKRSGLAE